MLGVSPHSNNIAYTGSIGFLNTYLPVAGGLSAVGLAVYDVMKAKPEEKKEHTLRNIFILTTAAIILGILCKNWLKAHPLIKKLFNNSEHAMEHLAAHTSREGREIIAKTPALKNIFSRSAGKTIPEIEAMITKALPAEAERIIPMLFNKYGAREATVLGRAEAALFSKAEAGLLGKVEAEIVGKVEAGLIGKFDGEMPSMLDRLSQLESKLPFFQPTADKMVSRLQHTKASTITRKSFIA